MTLNHRVRLHMSCPGGTGVVGVLRYSVMDLPKKGFVGYKIQ